MFKGLIPLGDIRQARRFLPYYLDDQVLEQDVT